jgi:hypothetical protein
MIPDFAFVAAYLFLEVIERNLEGALCFDGLSPRFKHNPRIQMRRTVGAVSRSFVRKHHMRFSAAVEVLRQRTFDALANMVGKRRSYLDLFA